MRLRSIDTIIVLALLVQCAIADLHVIGPKCGVLQCQRTQYCSDIDNQCRNCAEICDKDFHNFAEKLCESSCQDYLHDIKFAAIGDRQQSSNANYQSDIEKLFRLVSIALALVIILLIAITFFAVHRCYIWAQNNDVKLDTFLTYFKRERTQNDDIEKGSPNGLSNASTATPKRDLRLNMNLPQSEQPSATTPVTMTTSMSRRPAEDSTLDYAYDNHAMSGTSSPHSAKAARESNF